MGSVNTCAVFLGVLAACGERPSAKPDGAVGGADADAAEVDGAVPLDAGPDGGTIADATPDAAEPPQPLVLDPTFGDGGLVTAGLGNSADQLGGAAVQGTGTLVIVGTSQRYPDTLGQFSGEVAVARLTAAGTLDAGFGAGGVALVPVGASARGNAVALQSDGKIVVAGQAYFALSATQAFVVRLLADGALDTTFGTNGMTVIGGASAALAIAVAGDDSIAIAGRRVEGSQTALMVARLTNAGELDATFAGDGIATTAIGNNALAIGVARAAGGAIVAAGYTGAGTATDIAVVRYLADGTLDTSFGGDGIVTSALGAYGDVARAVGVTSTNQIVIAGDTAQGGQLALQSFVARYEADGDLDPLFGGGDGVTLDAATTQFVAMRLRANGRIVAASSQRVVQLLANGDPDPAFAVVDPDLGAGGRLAAIALAPDDTLYAAGDQMMLATDRSAHAVSHISASGVRDSTFGTAGLATIATGASYDLAFAVVANSDGSLVSGGHSLGLQRRVAVLGKHTAAGGLDTSFAGTGVLRLDALATVRDLARTSTGEIVVVGDAATGATTFRIARLTAMGALAATFGNSGIVSQTVVDGEISSPRAVTLDAMGRIVVAGTANTGVTASDGGVIRLLANGDLDPTFGGDGRVTVSLGSMFDELSDVALGPDGSIVAVGYGGGSRVVRLEEDGDLDPTFDADGIAAPAIASFIVDRVAVQPDGRVLIAGYRPFPAELVVARLTTAGALDSTFGSGGIVTYSTGGTAGALLPYGNRLRGPALVLDGSVIRVGATTTTGADEAMLLLTLDAQDGSVVGAVTAGAAGYWAGFALAAVPGGGVALAGRGFSATRGTEFGLARFVP